MLFGFDVPTSFIFIENVFIILVYYSKLFGKDIGKVLVSVPM